MHLILKKTILSRTRNNCDKNGIFNRNKVLWTLITCIVCHLNKSVSGFVSESLVTSSGSRFHINKIVELVDKPDTGAKWLEISGSGLLNVDLNDGFMLKTTRSVLECGDFDDGSKTDDNIKISNQTDNTLIVLLKYDYVDNNANNDVKNNLADDEEAEGVYLCVKENRQTEYRHLGIGFKLEG